ncbi:transmission-blocking target antigen s230 precursor [Plasmodium ovale curtisi]|uniref:Transmission-blocking target antigen s230 n=1 Tax=Plasmodium ovale curtisi TaxID=864141 RepID=A0A1A8VS08_PLAOA|nr:transmission-blocking target antigen s230 precursor [Plasmodium ovale curtisi]
MNVDRQKRRNFFSKEMERIDEIIQMCDKRIETHEYIKKYYYEKLIILANYENYLEEKFMTYEKKLDDVKRRHVKGKNSQCQYMEDEHIRIEKEKEIQHFNSVVNLKKWDSFNNLKKNKIHKKRKKRRQLIGEEEPAENKSRKCSSLDLDYGDGICNRRSRYNELLRVARRVQLGEAGRIKNGMSSSCNTKNRMRELLLPSKEINTLEDDTYLKMNTSNERNGVDEEMSDKPRYSAVRKAVVSNVFKESDEEVKNTGIIPRFEVTGREQHRDEREDGETHIKVMGTTHAQVNVLRNCSINCEDSVDGTLVKERKRSTSGWSINCEEEDEGSSGKINDVKNDIGEKMGESCLFGIYTKEEEGKCPENEHLLNEKVKETNKEKVGIEPSAEHHGFTELGREEVAVEDETVAAENEEVAEEKGEVAAENEVAEEKGKVVAAENEEVAEEKGEEAAEDEELAKTRIGQNGTFVKNEHGQREKGGNFKGGSKDVTKTTEHGEEMNSAVVTTEGGENKVEKVKKAKGKAGEKKDEEYTTNSNGRKVKEKEKGDKKKAKKGEDKKSRKSKNKAEKKKMSKASDEKEKTGKGDKTNKKDKNGGQKEEQTEEKKGYKQEGKKEGQEDVQMESKKKSKQKGQEVDEMESKKEGQEEVQVESKQKGQEVGEMESKQKGQEVGEMESKQKGQEVDEVESKQKGQKVDEVEIKQKGQEVGEVESKQKGKEVGEMESKQKGQKVDEVESKKEGQEEVQVESKQKGQKVDEVESKKEGQEEIQVESKQKGQEEDEVESIKGVQEEDEVERIKEGQEEDPMEDKHTDRKEHLDTGQEEGKTGPEVAMRVIAKMRKGVSKGDETHLLNKTTEDIIVHDILSAYSNTLQYSSFLDYLENKKDSK